MEAKIIKPKPIISYWKSGDPTLKIDLWRDKLTDINVINTKRLTDEFVDICLKEKHRIYLHIVITGMGQTQFEPKISSVKGTFLQIKKLIDGGFPQKQILVVVNPILPNDNGLNALKLLLKLFTEYKILRLRNIRFNVLNYVQLENSKFTIANQNIAKRPSTKAVGQYLMRNESFWRDYYKLIESYSTIISVDKGEEPLIGIRELMAFGYKNEWFTDSGEREKLIIYEKNSKYKPIVNLLSPKVHTRCANRCLLCQGLY